MSREFEIAETDGFFRKIKSHEYATLINKIQNFVYPQLRINPFYEPNNKKLKGNYKELYRYRIGDFRLFYIIESSKIIVIIVDIEKRKDSYKGRK